MKKHNLRKEVEAILCCNTTARNNDTVLYQLLIEYFYDDYLEDNKKTIKLDTLLLLPKYSMVERYRRYYNQKGMYLPTDEEVIKNRKLHEGVMREYFKTLV